MGHTENKAKLQREACHFALLRTGKGTKQHQNCIRRQKNTSNDEKLTLVRELLSHFNINSWLLRSDLGRPIMIVMAKWWKLLNQNLIMMLRFFKLMHLV